MPITIQRRLSGVFFFQINMSFILYSPISITKYASCYIQAFLKKSPFPLLIEQIFGISTLVSLLLLYAPHFVITESF